MKRYSTLLVINKHKQKKLDIFNYRMVKIKNITKGLEKVFSFIISGSVNCINFSKGNLTMSMKVQNMSTFSNKIYKYSLQYTKIDYKKDHCYSLIEITQKS